MTLRVWSHGVAAGGLNQAQQFGEWLARERLGIHDAETRLAARGWVRERADAEGRDIGPGPRRLLDNLLAIIVGAGRPLHTQDLAFGAGARVRRVSMALSELRRRGLVYGSELSGRQRRRHIVWTETPLGFATAVARARGIEVEP